MSAPNSVEIPPRPDAGASVVAVRIDHNHQAALARFFHEAWAAPPPALDPAAPAFALLVDGRMVGYVGTIPVRFHAGGRDYPGHWMKGFMVLPEYRNGAVGFLVLKRALQELPVTGSLSVAAPARRLFTATGFRELGTLSNQITLLRPRRVFSIIDPVALGLARPRLVGPALRVARRIGAAALAGITVGALLGLWRLVTRLDTAALRLATAPPKPEAIDRLWQQLRDRIPAGVVRDGRHFSRYGTGYRFVTVHEGPRLEGVAVIRTPRSDGDPRLRGLRIAVLSDILVDPANRQVQRAILRAAEAAAHDAGADALLCSASHSSLRRLLSHQGYLPFPGNVALLARGLPEETCPTIDAWWLTRGDGHADEVF
jgi:GNAT superfamily N-acetyltransferase